MCEVSSDAVVFTTHGGVIFSRAGHRHMSPQRRFFQTSTLRSNGYPETSFDPLQLQTSSFEGPCVCTASRAANRMSGGEVTKSVKNDRMKNLYLRVRVHLDRWPNIHGSLHAKFEGPESSVSPAIATRRFHVMKSSKLDFSKMSS